MYICERCCYETEYDNTTKFLKSYSGKVTCHSNIRFILVHYLIIEILQKSTYILNTPRTSRKLYYHLGSLVFHKPSLFSYVLLKYDNYSTCFNPFQHIDTFWHLCSRRLLKALWQKKKLWAISSFALMFSTIFNA